MLGRFDEARAILVDTRAELTERGGGWTLAATIRGFAAVELLAGDLPAAAELQAEACKRLEELGILWSLSSAAAELAGMLYSLDRIDEADSWARRAAELCASDHAVTQMFLRQVRAKVLARRGEHAEAQRLAREAVAFIDATDSLDEQGDAHADLADVLLLAGKPDQAAAALAQALERYERKENRVSAQRARTRLAEIHDTALR